MAGSSPTVHFSVDDGDLDDSELWAVIDSAVASRSRKPLLALKNSASPNQMPNHRVSPLPVKTLSRNPTFQNVRVEEVRVPQDREVEQDDQWGADCRPRKVARLADPASGDGRRVVVVTRPQPSPRVTFPSPYSSPDTGRYTVQEVSPVVESSPQNVWSGENKENCRHSLSGQFPSVSLFKQYQNAAMAILEKSDYTMISGSPFIKKSGWRKISFYFNLSFEIKDKSIEFDDNRNVVRAEFVVRASMQGGRFADGWGSCERREKRFLKPNHDIPSTAETRAKNKSCQDLLGIGEYRPGVSNAIR